VERQAFLARERAEIEIPRQPTDVKPVRVMNENFLAAQANFGSSSLKTSTILPGLKVSDMVDSRTGRTIGPGKNSGRSIARFKTETSEVKPSNEVRIVPRREDRIAGHAVDSSFASQATLKRETTDATAKLIVDDSAKMDSALALDTSMTSEDSVADSELTSGQSDFCLQGKCPVALVLEGKWVEGDARWGIVHRDRTYLFSSEENFRRFRERPDYYSPVLAAYDPVAFHDSGDFVDGMEENGVFMEKDDHQQIVLFASAANREKFQSNPQLYMRSVRKAIYTASRVDVTSESDGTKLR
jgi:YHS domain-containing protein